MRSGSSGPKCPMSLLKRTGSLDVQSWATSLLMAMSVRKTAFVGSVVGLVVSGTILVVLWNFGISPRVRHVLWPSSVMLTVDWCCTVRGILTTIFSIAINCLSYAAIALLLRAGIRVVTPHRAAGN